MQEMIIALRPNCKTAVANVQEATVKTPCMIYGGIDNFVHWKNMGFASMPFAWKTFRHYYNLSQVIMKRIVKDDHGYVFLIPFQTSEDEASEMFKNISFKTNNPAFLAKLDNDGFMLDVDHCWVGFSGDKFIPFVKLLENYSTEVESEVSLSFRMVKGKAISIELEPGVFTNAIDSKGKELKIKGSKIHMHPEYNQYFFNNSVYSRKGIIITENRKKYFVPCLWRTV